eukprot:CAMPEP_0185582124 /NCGR_PEP_ID=MMETSP0434-20130131/19878_1 /TAXON_ID=626734 ORGANISM="Favella taraikaensis, Strain Fe Narragansett Bay" /NCGR_SAMPLE_ID=MMETSP0434 /ASSEMBLY_ACC=CAM_ASM_000379 /LENGTH=260 /DNA_ID=CAMNT_0028200849 /DNA_START=55 /DNA_END=837 /DNA_ORIENTATION=+
MAALSVECALAAHYFDSLDRVHLKMNDDNRFIVMQLTDLHFGEIHNTHLDHETLHFIRSLVGKEKPDFIAITGDIVSGQAWDRIHPSFWEHNYNMLAHTLEELLGAYGIVPGYHDFEADIDSKAMLEIEARYKYAVSLPNFFDYHGNSMLHEFTYDVPIENATSPDIVDTRLWFFGTGRADCMGSGGMNCVRKDQIEWFKSRVAEIDKTERGERKRNGFAFMHHALQEHMHLVNHYPVHGQKRDISGCQGLNTGLFAEFK